MLDFKKCPLNRPVGEPPPTYRAYAGFRDIKPSTLADGTIRVRLTRICSAILCKGSPYTAYPVQGKELESVRSGNVTSGARVQKAYLLPGSEGLKNSLGVRAVDHDVDYIHVIFINLELHEDCEYRWRQLLCSFNIRSIGCSCEATFVTRQTPSLWAACAPESTRNQQSADV